MAKTKTKFICQSCGCISPKWMGKCPECSAWNSFTEEMEAGGRNNFASSLTIKKEKPESIIHIESNQDSRVCTNMEELDRVLGGGIVPGSFTLVGGDPGIGKSTLLLQVSHGLAEQGLQILYISGEESANQTKLRADRLNALHEKLFVLCETNLQNIEEAIEQVQPHLVVIDSIQTVYHPEISSAPGSVSQVRECAGHFMRLAKMQGIATILVGHVTKDGTIAGPKLLEHMVDSVLYFEGERHHAYRTIRAVKNRFGPANEMGIFEMRESGLVEVKNPSELFLSERPLHAPGSIVVASMEGTRPVLVELQALVSTTNFPSPRRMCTGIDYNRLSLIMAVLEKRFGMTLQNQDAYVNVAGGVKLDEPAVDLGIALCIASSFRDKPARAGDVVIGEVGLTGEVRAVSRIDQRVKEAYKLGFTRVILPENSMKGWTPPQGIEIVPVSTLGEAISAAFQ
ncbi:MAG: DNA repair protein RadA [Paenibacillus sp. RIFOXYA1_FULL_44_5]|nr:MAG: DNA repair protein RadA [Paenibacillus sp. RIFOXYA1_FULL_44_5]